MNYFTWVSGAGWVRDRWKCRIEIGKSARPKLDAKRRKNQGAVVNITSQLLGGGTGRDGFDGQN